MSVRITGGMLKGRVVARPVSDNVRPTTDMWRGTIFDALSHLVDIDDCTVVDLFAGTGILGIECLSRGAAHCTFVEKHFSLCRSIDETLTVFLNDITLRPTWTVEQADVFRVLALGPLGGRRADVVFADPPYDLRCCNRLLSHLSRYNVVEAGALVVLEHGPHEVLLPGPPWEIVWQKVKGDTAVDIVGMASIDHVDAPTSP
jgi:16S rRNA (guanine966-N2)-methyltransferase